MTLSARELSLLSNTDVLGYIQAQNAKRDAQVKVYKSFQDDAPVLGGGGGAERGLSTEGASSSDVKVS